MYWKRAGNSGCPGFYSWPGYWRTFPPPLSNVRLVSSIMANSFPFWLETVGREFFPRHFADFVVEIAQAEGIGQALGRVDGQHKGLSSAHGPGETDRGGNRGLAHAAASATGHDAGTVFDEQFF